MTMYQRILVTRVLELLPLITKARSFSTYYHAENFTRLVNRMKIIGNLSPQASSHELAEKAIHEYFRKDVNTFLELYRGKLSKTDIIEILLELWKNK